MTVVLIVKNQWFGFGRNRKVKAPLYGEVDFVWAVRVWRKSTISKQNLMVVALGGHVPGVSRSFARCERDVAATRSLDTERYEVGRSTDCLHGVWACR